jgi:hypothetical protein
MPVPKLSEAEITHLVQLSIEFASQQRDRFFPRSAPLSPETMEIMRPFFPAEVLTSARIVILENERLSNPSFVAELKQRGLPVSFDMSHIHAAAYFDVIIFQSAFTNRVLFHNLVHLVQYRAMGVDRWVEVYVRGLLNAGMAATFPVEAQAYELDQRFETNPLVGFSVEEEVKAWTAQGRYT